MREKKEINVFVGSQIRAARERSGLTQEQLAERISLGTKNVSDIERGVVGMTLSTFRRVCETLSVSSDTLLFGTPKENDASCLCRKIEKLPPKQFQAMARLVEDAMKMLEDQE